MPSRFRIAATITAVFVAYGLATQHHRRRYAQLARVLIEVGEERDILQAQIEYLAHLSTEKGWELEEFELIALNNMIPQRD